MDYFDSGSQARSLLKEGEDEEDYDSRRPSTEEIWAMVYQLSAAVAYCYDPNKQLGIMEDNDINEGDRNRARSSVVYHRDIKPQNSKYGYKQYARAAYVLNTTCSPSSRESRELFREIETL